MKIKPFAVGSMLAASCLYQSVLQSGLLTDTQVKQQATSISVIQSKTREASQNGQDIDVFNKKRETKKQLLAVENKIASMGGQSHAIAGSGGAHSTMGIRMARFSGQLVYGERISK